MGTHEAFWIDDDFDRERADDDGGRYGAKVRRDTFLFADTVGDISPVGFACAAWRIATPPWLDPGLIRWHRRILTALCVRNRYDGSLIGQISLVSPLPAALTWSNQWWRDRGWRDWPQTFGQFLQPSEQDLAKSPHIRASLLIEVPMSVAGLPAAPETLDGRPGGEGPARRHGTGPGAQRHPDPDRAPARERRTSRPGLTPTTPVTRSGLGHQIVNPWIVHPWSGARAEEHPAAGDQRPADRPDQDGPLEQPGQVTAADGEDRHPVGRDQRYQDHRRQSATARSPH